MGILCHLLSMQPYPPVFPVIPDEDQCQRTPKKHLLRRSNDPLMTEWLDDTCNTFDPFTSNPSRDIRLVTGRHFFGVTRFSFSSGLTTPDASCTTAIGHLCLSCSHRSLTRCVTFVASDSSDYEKWMNFTHDGSMGRFRYIYLHEFRWFWWFLLLNFVGKYVPFSMDPMGSGTDPMEKNPKFRGFTWFYHHK